MPLLDSHLEQIALSSNAIADLPFPPPRIFTNALLGSHDITALIRDTEAHEHIPKTCHTPGHDLLPELESESMASRIYSTRNNRNHSAVARVLGSDMMEEIKRSAGTSTRGPRGEVNIEVLLQGAEMLCNVYPVDEAPEKIASLRYRHGMITESIARLEDRVATNTAELARMSHGYGDDDDDYDVPVSQPEAPDVTDEEIQQELAEIQELELKKRALEERVTGMERDLGGLMG
ncbi:hypothetical protein N7510_000928 [Penicillium lagena]|uniref:uncharacterized protein n=1 Tax=Penicillium lagena TaxID=94218 RepID=UPI00253F87EF|nr:uncharacterized protein N7510_000928 [Penicillium lagena]KAJ5624619.1 hypothetical protein N7510_000928 [Penicillium lagena]